MPPRLKLNVKCKCAHVVVVNTSSPEKYLPCWKCNRLIKVVLNPNGSYRVYIREMFAQHWEESDRVPDSDIRRYDA